MIQISGKGLVAPTKVISLTGNLSFEDLQVGETSTKVLTINNNGNTQLSVTDISLPIGFSANWISGAIAANESKNVTITFSPVARQVYSGIITVTSDATSGTNMIQISGKGLVAPTKVISLTGNLSFEDLQVGETSTKVLTINNNGNTQLSVTDISLPIGFSANWISGAIAANESKNVTITFSPVARQVYSGIITVTSDATSGINAIEMSGTGALVSGINDNIITQFSCFPNPTNGHLTIKSDINIKRILIYNMVGVKVYENKYTSMLEKEISIDLTGLSSGMYFLNIDADSIHKTIKIIIE
jgi:hypothetical protein